MKKRILITLIIAAAIFAVYSIAKVLLTKRYHHTHRDELQINIGLSESFGVGQSGAYSIDFQFENKKTGKSVTFHCENDRFWYEFFLQDITIKNEKRKTIVIHDLEYGYYVFVDYKSLKQRSKDFFDFNLGLVLDSNDLILQELTSDPIWTVGCHWQEICDR